MRTPDSLVFCQPPDWTHIVLIRQPWAIKEMHLQSSDIHQSLASCFHKSSFCATTRLHCSEANRALEQQLKANQFSGLGDPASRTGIIAHRSMLEKTKGNIYCLLLVLQDHIPPILKYWKWKNEDQLDVTSNFLILSPLLCLYERFHFPSRVPKNMVEVKVKL